MDIAFFLVVVGLVLIGTCLLLHFEHGPATDPFQEAQARARDLGDEARERIWDELLRDR